MTTALIKFIQGALTPPAGQALIGVIGVSVLASNANNAGVSSFEWFMVDVPPTSAVPTGLISAGPTVSFTPDVPGGYLVRLTVFDLSGNSSSDIRAFQVPEHSGRFIPPFSAEASPLNFGGQTRGWAPDMEQWLRYLDGETPVVVPTTGTIHNLATVDANGQTIRSIRFTGVAPSLGGLANGYEGRELIVYADGGPVTIIAADGGSLAANRFGLGSTISQGNFAYLLYANGLWRAAAAGSSPPVQAVELYIGGAPGYTDSGVFTREGGMSLDLVSATTQFPATVGSLVLHARLEVDVQKTAGATSVEVKLVDVTNGGVTVTGTDMTYSASNDVTRLVSSDLTIGGASGNLRNDAVTIYELQLNMNGGSLLEKAYVLGARLQLRYV